MKYASTSSKVVPLVCLVVVLTVSLTLFGIRNERYIGKFPDRLKNYRNEFGVAVQVLSTVLSMAQILVLTSLINFAARIKLFRSPTPMSSLSFWSALSTPRFDQTLPFLKLLLVMVMLWLGTVLGALWAGSLTPLTVTALRSDGQVLVPLFNSNLKPTVYPALGNGAIVLQCGDNIIADPRGPSYPPLDNCIVWSKLPNLIMKATTATNVTDPGQYSKIDNSSWTYRGRSYGKGSLAGLLDVVDTNIATEDLGFSYREPGYNIQASCSRQNSTIFPFQLVYNATKPGQLTLWSSDTVTLGSENFTVRDFYLATPTFNHFNSQPFGYFAWTTFAQNQTNQTQHYLATGSQPGSWSMNGPDKILCQIDFVPMVFNVNVSKIDQFITVTPLERIEDFNQTGNIADMIMMELDMVSRLSSSSLAFSSLYIAIERNQQAAQLAYRDIDAATAWVYSLRDAISGIADDLLTYHGILAVSANESQSIRQPAQRHFQAVEVGQAPYQIIQLAINAVLCVAYFYEAFRTRCWRRLPAFDFLDIKSLILASSGKKDSREPAARKHHTRMSFGWSEADSTKLYATYNEQSGTKLRLLDSSEEQRQLTSPTEQSFHFLDDLDFSRSYQTPVLDGGGTVQPHVTL